jgi:hypothetical protein
VKPTQDAPACLPATVTCAVAAHAHVQVALENLPALRQRPGPGIGQSLPANLLKHADEQTVAGLAAVLHAIADFNLDATSFDPWGIVAAPCFLGRATLVQSRERFAAEGAWGLSPHFIPHRSQHAVSGTISQVLKVHGPNFGTGGGPGAVREALVAGALMAQDNPGVWVVMTGWEPEFIPDANGRPTSPVTCHAVALALLSYRAARQGPFLRLVPLSMSARNGSDHHGGMHDPSPPEPSLPALVQALADRQGMAWGWEGFGRLEWSGWDGSVNGAIRARALIVQPSTAAVRATAQDRGRKGGAQSHGAGTENAR